MKWAATLAVAAAVVGLTSGECPITSFTCMNGQCFYFITSTGDWYNQRGLCTALGADIDIAKVDINVHNDVYQHIKDDEALNNECWWLGGWDQTSEGRWTWVHDGEEIPLDGPQWDICEKEPNGGSAENHLAMCPDDDYYFSDYPSTKRFYVICQDFSVMTCSD